MLSLVLSAALALPTITKAEVRPTYSGAHATAAYMVIQSAVADRLIGASCDCASSVEAHQTVVSNGVARMVGPSPVELPAKTSVEFATGGRHLMLMGLKGPLIAGKTVKITLKFEKAGASSVTFKIKGADMAPMAGMDHTSH
jgi:copper(I)-binding protein